MKNKIIFLINEILQKMGIETEVQLTPARGHADYATNVAMKLSKQLGKAPREIAEEITESLNANFIDKVEVAGPGFINIFLKNEAFGLTVDHINEAGADFGRGEAGEFINVEYVSANPTGHLHLGHARGAAVGSSLVNILRFAGNKVDSEYYINDAGNQIDTLGISIFERYRELKWKRT